MPSHRPEQISQELKRIVAESLHEIVEFPPHVFATVVGASVSADLREGTVWLTFYPESCQDDALEILKKSRNKIRHYLAGHLPIKHIPRLNFKLADQKWFEGQELRATL